jgi:hypothetical protein
MKKLGFLFIFAGLGLIHSQTFSVVQKTTSLSATAEVITIQQPQATPRTLVKFVSAYVDCSVQCTLTLERNGSAATSTTLTPRNIDPAETAPLVQAFSSSNSSGGSVLQVLTIQGGGSVLLDLSNFKFLATYTNGANLTLRTSSITGTVHITVLFSETAL